MPDGAESSSGNGARDNSFAELEAKAAKDAYPAQNKLKETDLRLKQRVECLKRQCAIARCAFLILLPLLLSLVFWTILPKPYFGDAIAFLGGIMVIIYVILHIIKCCCFSFIAFCKHKNIVAGRHLIHSVRKIRDLLRKQIYFLPDLTDAEAEDAAEVQRLKKVLKQDWFLFIICIVILLDIVIFSALPGWSPPIVLLVLEALGLFVLSDRMDMPETHELIDELLHQAASKMNNKE